MNIKNRKQALDILRIIATVFIVFHHYQQVVGDFPGGGFSFYTGRFYFGYMVEFFFVLSGFLTFPYINKIENGMNFGVFWGKKARRFLPWVFASSAVFFILLMIYRNLTNENWLGVESDYVDIIINALGMQAGWFFKANRLNFPLWYISILFQCYGWFYLLTWIGKKSRIPKEILFFIMVIIGTVIKTCLARGIIIHAPFFNGYSARGYCAFFFGLLVAMYCRKRKRQDYYIVVGIVLAILLAFFFINLNVLEYLLYILGFGVLTAVFSVDWLNRKLKGNVIWTIGESTFYVYIWHMPCLIVCFIIKDVFIKKLDLKSYFVMFVFTIILFLAGWLMNRAFRKLSISTFLNNVRATKRDF